MVPRIPQICPISELARNARGLIARARVRQEPIVITQRGRDVAVLVPIERYRELERQLVHRVINPRLARPEDAERFSMSMTAIERPEDSGAGIGRRRVDSPASVARAAEREAVGEIFAGMPITCALCPRRVTRRTA